jgi:hypothetical protein
MNRFDEVLIVNPGLPDQEGTRPMYGHYAQVPVDYGYGVYADPYAGYADPYAGYAIYPDGYGNYGDYGYAEAPTTLYGVDPYGYGYYAEPDPSLYGYGYADQDPLAGYAEEYPPGYGHYAEPDPRMYGEASPEMVGWGAETLDANPDLGAYVRDIDPAPFNAVCPIVGNVRLGEADEFGAYVTPGPVGPTCGSFTPQPGTPPPVPDTLKPLW